jgi:hypothetical protein
MSLGVNPHFGGHKPKFLLLSTADLLMLSALSDERDGIVVYNCSKHRSSVAVYGQLPSNGRCMVAYFAAVTQQRVYSRNLCK